jgi:hypothetical protein
MIASEHPDCSGEGLGFPDPSITNLVVSEFEKSLCAITSFIPIENKSRIKIGYLMCGFLGH